MSEYKPSLRMPDNSRTTDVDAYIKSWHDYHECAVAFFPGYVIAGSNPGVRLQKRRFYTREDGQEVYAVDDTIDLSVDAIDTLVKMALEGT